MNIFNILKTFVIMILPISIVPVVGVKCDKLDNQPCLTRKTIVNTNKNEPRYYPFSIELNKCSGSCDTLDNPYAKNCLSNKTVKRDVKIYDMLYNRYIPMTFKEDVTCKCECRLNGSVCSHVMQKWDESECKCKCDSRFKDKYIHVCKKGYVWDPNVCDCIYVGYDINDMSDASDFCDEEVVIAKNAGNSLKNICVYGLFLNVFFSFFNI